MSFHISVVLPEHLEFINQAPDNVDEIDSWIEEWQKRNLYDAPLDAGGVIYEYWSKIANHLHLPLIAAIYNEGLKLYASEVPALEIEMAKLERYWEENELAGVETFEWDQNSAKKDLKERLNYLREAAEVAKRNRAVLIVC
ncbi:MAG: hypothetical protein ABR568_16325 [Pyrinomonadaceae bacterium]